MAVFVLDKKKRPLMSCSEKRARLLLERGRAVVYKMYPFTIRLKDRLLEDSELQPVRFKVDPGSKESGIALVREEETINEETGEIKREVTLFSAIHLKHRGQAISKALKSRAMYRRNRRNKLRYRKTRFDNRTKPEG